MTLELPKRAKDLTGKKFNRLTVLEYAGKKKGYVTWLCLCECGNETIVRGKDLTRRIRSVKSCGCYVSDRLKRQNTTHGRKSHPLYPVWKNMIDRCTNKRNKDYRHYGGRGISVCKRWLDIENFITDMNPKPNNHSLDRIDTNGNYTPGNCRWATSLQQNNNRRDNVILEHDGLSMTLTEWSQYLNMPRQTLQDRYYKGWKHSDILTKPIKNRSYR